MRHKIDWERIRAEWEAGGSFRGLGKKHPVSYVTIKKHADKEGWSRNLEAQIRKRVSEKVVGINDVSSKKQEQAIDAEAERRVAVIQRHRKEWDASRERLYAGLAAHKNASLREDGTKETDQATIINNKKLAFEDLKAAKISSEAMTLIQAGERRAWKIDDEMMKPQSMLPASVNEFV